MPGGGPQGGTFGIWSYLSQSNNNADCVDSSNRFKFVDDLTFLEVINLLNIGLASYNFKRHVSSEVPSQSFIVDSNLLQSQHQLQQINDWTEKQKMILHPAKTKNMIFNFSKNKQFSTNMTIKGENVETLQETRILGVILSADMRWNSNTKKIVKDANKRLSLLHAASKFTDKISDLKLIYMSFIRSKLESSSVVWHSSLSNGNRRDLERVQKSAFKIILKNHYDNYENALKVLNLETLDKRRETLCLKFAKNCLKNEKMKKLFPLEKHKHSMKKRSQSIFKVYKSRTSRYQHSAIPYMQRLLNEDFKQRADILN